MTNDLVTDNRMSRICSSLGKMGFKVLLIGRHRKDSLPLDKRDYETKRLKLIFNKGSLFYAEYNVRLFVYLLFSRFNVLLANDLDTLPANYLASRLRRRPVVYDSHEFYTEVPELMNRPGIRRFWLGIEKFILPKLKYAYTVSNSIAREYKKRYRTEFHVIRNVPVSPDSGTETPAKHDKTENIILYQGSLNEARGLEYAIRAMKFIDNARFIIAGEGDISQKLKQLVEAEKLDGKVVFTGRLAPGKLKVLTSEADLGLSIEEDRGLNYRYALPNKLFDYIHAGLPVLVNNLPEMASIVSAWQIGLVTPSLEPEVLAGKIKDALFDEKQREEWAVNLKMAASELCWEKEELKLQEIFQRFLE